MEQSANDLPQAYIVMPSLAWTIEANVPDAGRVLSQMTSFRYPDGSIEICGRENLDRFHKLLQAHSEKLLRFPECSLAEGMHLGRMDYGNCRRDE
jgi:hypothetical protein